MPEVKKKNSVSQAITQKFTSPVPIAPSAGATTGSQENTTSFDTNATDSRQNSRSSLRMSRRVVSTTKSAEQLGQSKSFDMIINSLSDGLTDTSSSANMLIDPAGFRTDHERLKRRLQKANAMLLNPRSKMMQYWDMCTLSALFFTATVTPYEVCLIWSPTKVDFLFVVNNIVNFVFIIDMVFIFFLPFNVKDQQPVKNHKLIAKQYLKSWFFLDLVSILPLDWLMVTSVLDTEDVNPSMLKMVRMIRLFRLIKLARILRASRIFSRWENQISLQYSTRTLIKWILTITMTLHWFSCLLGILAQMQGTLRTDELESALSTRMLTDPQCYGCNQTIPVLDDAFCGDLTPCLTPCEVNVLAQLNVADQFAKFGAIYSSMISFEEERIRKAEMWLCRYSNQGVAVDPAHHGDVWMAGMYVAMLQLGGGVGSIVPENLGEYIVFFICLLFGSVLWAIVVGTICGMIATGDPHEIEYRQTMDSLNYFLADMSMPGDLRIRVREYMRSTKELVKHASYNELVGRLSPTLRGIAVLHMSQQTLASVWYLRECEDEFLVDVAVKMGRAGYAPREKVPASSLHIVMRGVAAKAGSILTQGAHWGEDMIVSAVTLRDLRHASALSYLEVATLERDDLYDCLTSYPVSRQQVREAAMKIALQRAVLVISEYVRAAKERSSSKKKASYEYMRSIFAMPENVDDPASLLASVAGINQREIDDETQEIVELVEENDNPNPQYDDTELGRFASRMEVQMKDERAERARLEQRLQGVADNVNEIKQILQTMSRTDVTPVPS